MLSDKKILIGVTGGIAAYKICELIRMFKRQNAEVFVVVTPSALKFVTKLTLETLSNNPVAVEQFDIDEYKPEHISLADSADIFVIAPASANTISKIANGICDNLLTTVAAALKKPVLIAPAMNCNMWENPAVQENILKLKNYGCEILEPEDGFLACGATGKGRLCSLEKIYDKTVEILTSKKKLLNKRVVITSGGTIENLDTVRYISNFSSGKMGEALADVAFQEGADVCLISTKEIKFPKKYLVKSVKSAVDMEKAVESELDTADIIIMAAAVADYRAKNVSPVKMKKTSDDEISITLVKNPDILKELSQKKKENQIIVGFCAESENLLENAAAKIKNKGCDFLVANDISRKDIGFSSDYNEVYIIDKAGQRKKIGRAKKIEIAKQIFEEILK